MLKAFTKSSAGESVSTKEGDLRVQSEKDLFRRTSIYLYLKYHQIFIDIKKRNTLSPSWGWDMIKMITDQLIQSVDDEPVQTVPAR